MRNFQGYFSRTFHDLNLQFPRLSRTKVLFQDFPGPGIFKKKSRTFREAWKPWSIVYHPAGHIIGDFGNDLPSQSLDWCNIPAN